MKTLIYILLLLIFSLASYSQETLKVHLKGGEIHAYPIANIDSLTITGTSTPVVLYSVEGVVQKGPFLNGTSITVFELDPNLTQTGRSFETQILNKEGGFSLDHMNLSNTFVLLKANGFYFNEVSGSNSTAQFTLFSLSDLKDKSSVNINILTHLEKDRIRVLTNEGVTFREAKAEAREEILRMFSLDNYSIDDPEYLNIREDGQGNAILLAISVILQGQRTVAELSQILADINVDFSPDGILDNHALGSNLINHAKYLNLPLIRTNLQSYYSTLAVTPTIPNFEKYVNQFRDSTKFVFTNLIEYPDSGDYGLNILSEACDTFTYYDYFSFRAKLPVATSLKIKMSGAWWGITVVPNAPVNWTHPQFDRDNLEQFFTATMPGSTSEQQMRFIREPGTRPDAPIPPHDVTIEYYENGSLTPTKIRRIYVKQ